MTGRSTARIQADFNGLSGDILCLSHTDVGLDDAGNEVPLRFGMILTAFEEDEDENGKSDPIEATGTVISSPEWLSCKGSKWALQIDASGVKHQSDT